MRITKAQQRQGLREAIMDERFTISVINETLAQPNLRDGQRADLQKVRGIAVSHLCRLLGQLHG
jgi:hypothetical protein